MNPGREKSTSADDRRDSYRREVRPDHHLNVSVAWEGQLALPGALEDLSSGGAGVRLRRGVPGPDVGENVVLTFHSARARRQFEVPALTAALREESEGGRLFGFQFVDGDGVFAELDPYLLRFFNRRGATRHRPPLDLRVPAELHAGETRLTVTLNDISLTGMAITCRPEDTGAVLGLRFARARLRIPGMRMPLDFAGTVLYQRPTPAGLRVGLGFPEGGLVGGLRKERAFAAFLEACERSRAAWDQAA